MSGKIMGAVWDLDLQHSQQLVLLAMADHADHLGNNVYPSTGLVAWKTGYSERQVQRIIQSLVIDKLLIVVKQNKHAPNVYRIDVSAGKQKKPYQPPKRGDILTPQENNSPDKMSDLSDLPRGDILSGGGDIAMSGLGVTSDVTLTVIEPSLNHLSKPADAVSTVGDSDPFGSNIDAIPKKQAELIATVKADLAAEKLSSPEIPKVEIPPFGKALEDPERKIALKESPPIQPLTVSKSLAVALPAPVAARAKPPRPRDLAFDAVGEYLGGKSPEDIKAMSWRIGQILNGDKRSGRCGGLLLYECERQRVEGVDRAALAADIRQFAASMKRNHPDIEVKDCARFMEWWVKFRVAHAGRTAPASAPKADPACPRCKGLGVIVTTGTEGDYSEPCNCKKASVA